MNTEKQQLGEEPVLMSRDVVAGLGAAPRDLLATGLALFDDSTMQSRLGKLSNSLLSKIGKMTSDVSSHAETAASVQDQVERWKRSRLSDDALRVLLWIYLREAFGLPARTFASLRSADTAADDIAARALHSMQAGALAQVAEKFGMKQAKDRPATLDALARLTLGELIATLRDGEDEHSAKARKEFIAETRRKLEQLAPEDRKRLLDRVGADDLNDAAIRKIIFTGAGLGAFSVGVGMAGFSAYILAAQVSAFIPLVSGPALVSVVSVLSNPITLVAATAGIGWWAVSSASQKIRAGVGVRVLSLLALNGLSAGHADIRTMVQAFTELKILSEFGDLSENSLKNYKEDWARISEAQPKSTNLDDAVARIMERSARTDDSDARLAGVLNNDPSERSNTATLSILTLGDIAYNAFNIDPTVIDAADFSRVEALDNPETFAVFAHNIEEMGAVAQLGAINNLKGYVAERVVASQLAAQGHAVEFPATSSEPGWDLSVDGVKFQVKDGETLSGLYAHFTKYGQFEYPVIANAELANELDEAGGHHLPDWAGQVHFVQGYSNEIVEHATHASIEAGDGVLHPHVPLFTLVLSGIRNVGRMNRGEVTRTQAFQEILLDGGTRAGLAALGGYAGVGIGLLVFGPAGALVLGGATPILAQMQARRFKGTLDKFVKDSTYSEWEEKARANVEALAGEAEEALDSKIKLVQSRVVSTPKGVATAYIQWRINQELCFLFEARNRLEALIEDESMVVEQFCERLISWLSTSTIHPVCYQKQLQAVAATFKKRPLVSDRAANVAVAASVAVVDKSKRVWSGILGWVADRASKNQ